MQKGLVNIMLDQHAGSSGKGLMSTYLAHRFSVENVSSANFPNAGHTTVLPDGSKFVAKAIPTAAFLRKGYGLNVECFITPGSGFFVDQLLKEWEACDKPVVYIHDRAIVVTDEHAARERSGPDSTGHIASTMQGSGTAYSDKVLRKKGVILARDVAEILNTKSGGKISVLPSMQFRDLTHGRLGLGQSWLHEGSQGYALSIDHGIEYPYTTSRNCNTQACMDYLAVPPNMVGDIYMNLRTYPIRVGNLTDENGKQLGYSGGWYEDQKEVSWEYVAETSGMPEEERTALAERERTTVTKRVRRVSTFSWIGLRDAVRVNGVTKLCVNFIQYFNWKDAGLQGSDVSVLSAESRSFIDRVESETNVPVILVGTGARHDQVIDLL